MEWAWLQTDLDRTGEKRFENLLLLLLLLLLLRYTQILTQKIRTVKKNATMYMIFFFNKNKSLCLRFVIDFNITTTHTNDNNSSSSITLIVELQWQNVCTIDPPANTYVNFPPFPSSLAVRRRNANHKR